MILLFTSTIMSAFAECRRELKRLLARSRYMYHYSQKYSWCKTGLNSSQAIGYNVCEAMFIFIKKLKHVVM